MYFTETANIMSVLYFHGFKHLHNNKIIRNVASITNGTTDRQDKYLVSSISVLVASHFNSGYRTIITAYESVLENV